ncbi:MAG TPA: secondary thiamine-phosphate synthase enzyme YjbQ [Anaerolineales bacterium]|nr:secondary thiamine-phosphate synthase enzyme YjbQ [Anaerolineales bacterium]
MTVKSLSIQLSTNGDTDIHEITSQIAHAVSKSGLKTGTVTIFCPSSTSALTTIEFESGALNDLKRLFEEIIPQDHEYAHNARWHDGNGHSHIRASLLGPSLTIPFVEGELTLGTWQQVIYIDFDNKPRRRELILQLIGE